MSRRATPVRNLMTTPPAVAYERTWFTELVRLMEAHDIGCLPILDRRGRVAGVVTDADLLLEACRPGRPRAAGEVMTAPAITISPGATAAEALRRLRDQAVKHLVVVGREDVPIGVLSRRDLMVPLCRNDIELRAEVEEIADRTLRARRAGVGLTVDDGAVAVRGLAPGDPARARLRDALARVEGVVAIDDGAAAPALTAREALP